MGLSLSGAFVCFLPCVPNTQVSFGAVCSFVCAVFCRQRLCLLVLPWHHTSGVIQLLLDWAELQRSSLECGKSLPVAACNIPHQHNVRSGKRSPSPWSQNMKLFKYAGHLGTSSEGTAESYDMKFSLTDAMWRRRGGWLPLRVLKIQITIMNLAVCHPQQEQWCIIPVAGWVH